MTVEQARERFSKDLLLVLNDRDIDHDNTMVQLHRLLSEYKGGNCPVKIKVRLQGASSALELPEQWRISPKDLLLEELKKNLPEQKSFIRY
jgi:DNA polymerase-3 subunit alpha